MKTISTLCLFVLIGAALSACNCDMTWYGGCAKRVPVYNPDQPKYDAYERARERKVVPGLGGAIYSTQ